MMRLRSRPIHCYAASVLTAGYHAEERRKASPSSLAHQTPAPGATMSIFAAHFTTAFCRQCGFQDAFPVKLEGVIVVSISTPTMKKIMPYRARSAGASMDTRGMASTGVLSVAVLSARIVFPLQVSLDLGTSGLSTHKRSAMYVI